MIGRAMAERASSRDPILGVQNRYVEPTVRWNSRLSSTQRNRLRGEQKCGTFSGSQEALEHSAAKPMQGQALSVIIERVARGDHAAFTSLYDSTCSWVYGLALRILRDQGAAEDITSEVYTQVYRQAATYNGQRGSALAWLATLTRSRAIDRQRKELLRQQRETPLELLSSPVSDASPEAQSADLELQHIVRMALATLDPQQRQVLESAYFEGLSHAEIAAKFSQPLGTVKTRLRTGLQTLRTLLYPLLVEVES